MATPPASPSGRSGRSGPKPREPLSSYKHPEGPLTRSKAKDAPNVYPDLTEYVGESASPTVVEEINSYSTSMSDSGDHEVESEDESEEETLEQSAKSRKSRSNRDETDFKLNISKDKRPRSYPADEKCKKFTADHYRSQQNINYEDHFVRKEDFKKYNFENPKIESTTSADSARSSKNVSSTPSSSNNIIIYIIPIVVLVIAILLGLKIYLDGGNPTVNFSKEIHDISAKFPQQDTNMWEYIKIGIERMVDASNVVHGEPAIFFMVQSPDADARALKISKEIGEAAGKYIDKKNRISQPTIVTYNALNSLDEGTMLDTYRKDLEKSHVFIVEEIEKVSPPIVQDLRYLCDEENPAIPHLLVFLIMNWSECKEFEVSQLANATEANKVALVEKCLTTLWNGKEGLSSAVLKPLFARILSVIFVIGDK